MWSILKRMDCIPIFILCNNANPSNSPFNKGGLWGITQMSHGIPYTKSIGMSWLFLLRHFNDFENSPEIHSIPGEVRKEGRSSSGRVYSAQRTNTYSSHSAIIFQRLAHFNRATAIINGGLKKYKEREVKDMSLKNIKNKGVKELKNRQDVKKAKLSGMAKNVK